ncbi:hypothetical protein AGMMS50284_6860 [Clostridia bacterium]|nr:hypothetical protein AGMMS50284_6860 [Clostridia bacterium]
MEYLNVPGGNKWIRNHCMHYLFEEIGRKYGTDGGKPRKKGLKYLQGYINGKIKKPDGKESVKKHIPIGQIKKTIYNYITLNIFDANVDTYVYFVHNDNYSIIINELGELITSHDLIEFVRRYKENRAAEENFTWIIQKEIRNGIDKVVKSGNNSKNRKIAQEINLKLDKNDFLI